MQIAVWADHGIHAIRQIMLHVCFIAVTLFAVSVTAFANDPSCPADVPVNVVLSNGALIRGLAQRSFLARHQHTALPIQFFADDNGPRRIVFVVETGGRIPEAARKIETNVLSAILSSARPEDSFALLTAHGPRKELRFGATREAVRASINDLGGPAEGKNQENGALDAVLEAVAWFQQPQPGDSIVLMAMGIEKGNRTTYSKVRDALAAAGARLFGFQLGPVVAGYYNVGTTPGPGGVFPTAYLSPNEESVFALSDETGGFVFEENAAGDPQREYKLTDQRLMFVKKLGGQIYKAVTAYYHLRLEAPRKGLVLELADPIRQQFPEARVLYPKILPVCSAAPPREAPH